VRVIKRLKGGSQPVLIHASDGFFYVIKFVDNLQGSNVAFNECMGMELYRACGLPGPGWSPVWASDEFIDRNPDCWYLTPDGPRRPQAGWCFGSRFLGLQEAPLREILSGGDFKRIRNRTDFWKARLLDGLCQHADNRQALFLEDESGWLDAYFIDHGHLFGGPQGAAKPVMATSRYLDNRIYPCLTAARRKEIERSICSVNRLDLMRIVQDLPVEWVTPSAILGLQEALDCLADESRVHRLADAMLEASVSAKPGHGRKPPRRVLRENGGLPTQLPTQGFTDFPGSWAGFAAGGER
jgi:hypothetical protein